MKQIILFPRNRESAFVFRRQVHSEVLRISGGLETKNFDFLCLATPIITTSMPVFATYRAYVEYSILFAKIVNPYFGRQQFFCSCATSKFWWRVCENQGQENLSVWENLYRYKCLCLASEKFVLASESHLSLVTGLASWKVSLFVNIKPISRILGTTSGFKFPIINILFIIAFLKGLVDSIFK